MNITKSLFLLFAIAFTVVGCEKENCNKELPACGIIPSANVPMEVSDAYSLQYEGIIADAWFDREGTGYAAVITRDGKQTIIYISPEGKIQKEFTPEGKDKEAIGCGKGQEYSECNYDKGSHGDKGSHEWGKGSHQKKGKKVKKHNKDYEKCYCDFK